MAQSSGRPIGERLKIAVFAVGSFDRREEVRNGGFSDLLTFCGYVKFRLRIFSLMNVLRLSRNMTWNIFAVERFAAKSKFDLQ